MKKSDLYNLSILFALTLILSCCRVRESQLPAKTLSEELNEVIKNAEGCVGVAFVSDHDTVLINNGVRYPMMSVFKLHEALAVCGKMESLNHSLDSLLRIAPEELDRDTWSPMLKEYGETEFVISVGELIRYALISSDNNASNLLFERIISPEATDSYLRTVAPDTTFSIRWEEGAMKTDHNLAYDNYTSPLSAALLIRNLFTHNTPPLRDGEFIRDALTEVTTGRDRLGAPLEGMKGIFFAHKTGSGYRNSRGELTAQNDVGYFRLRDGRDYALAVLIRDFTGSESEASSIIADISRLVYNHFSSNSELAQK